MRAALCSSLQFSSSSDSFGHAGHDSEFSSMELQRLLKQYKKKPHHPLNRKMREQMAGHQAWSRDVMTTLWQNSDRSGLRYGFLLQTVQKEGGSFQTNTRKAHAAAWRNQLELQT